MPGADLDGMHYLRDIADVDRLRPAFVKGARLAMVGGGYIGLEVAAVAVKHGLQVDVFEAMDRVMARAVSPVVSEFYERVHREAGVRFHLRTGVEAIRGKGKVEGVRAGGETYPADLALVGIGVVPNEELAREAGLGCDDGIVVNEFAADRRSRHLRRRRLHAPYRPRRPSRASGIRAERHRSGKARRTRDDGQAHALQGSAVVLVRSIRSQAADRGARLAGPTRPCCAAIPRPANLRSSTCAKAASPPSSPLTPRPEYLVGRKLIAEGKAIAPERLADTAIPMKNIS